MAGSTKKKIKESSSSLVKVAETHILELIETKRLQPGEYIDFGAIAEELNSSRTPIRESIRQLHSLGLVEPVSGGHFRVTTLNMKQIRSYYAVRLGLELKASALAAERITDPELKLLKQNMEIFEAQKCGSDLLPQIDTQFHEIIYEASRNRYVAKRLKELRLVLGLLPRNSFENPERFENIIKEHKNIVDALRYRDVSRSMSATKIHIEHAMQPLVS